MWRFYFIFFNFRTYRPVALRINNLGDDVACLDGSDYKSVPGRKVKETDCFSKLVEELK